jgi:hypothetical protein
MGRDSLELNIMYDVKKDEFEVKGDVNKEGEREIIENFLRQQIGAGRDKRKLDMKSIKKDYNIRLTWYPENDRIDSASDTGNLGLRDGILKHYLEKLKENKR